MKRVACPRKSKLIQKTRECFRGSFHVRASTRERVCTLRKDQHKATIETRVANGVGRELILSIDGDWRRMRVFLSGRTPLIDDAVVATETWLAQSGYERAWP
jgi:hypothetical protein